MSESDGTAGIGGTHAPTSGPGRAGGAGSAFVRRTLALLAAGVAALAAITVVAVVLATRADNLGDVVEETTNLRNRSTDLLGYLRDAETGQRGYLLTGDEAYLRPFAVAREWLTTDVARLRRVGDIAAARRVADLVEEKVAELSRTVDLARAGRREEALAIVRTDRGNDVMEELRAFLGGRVALREGQLRAALADLGATSRALTWTSVGGGVAILLFAALAAWVVSRYVRDLRAAEREVAALNAGLEARVRDRTTDLSRANEEIQRFAYIVSHDLRSPLVNVMGFTKELETGLEQIGAALEPAPTEAALKEARTAVREDMPEAIGFIRTSTSKMDRLINAILRLSREGRRELRPERVDLAATLAAVADTVKHQAEAAGARVEVPDKAPALTTDRLALEQIIGNLVDNAVKYLARDRPGIVTIAAAKRAGSVEVTVADNGRGIAPGDLERVFELFRRSGPQDRPGEGIGLAHVRALARRLGGDVTVESTLGQGSRFRLSLPPVLDPAA